MKKVFIINSRGEEELFSARKVERSAKRVGASSNLAKRISAEIEKNIYSGMTTNEIFHQVKGLLHHEVPAAALKFNLKEAMRMLGPTGFKFEKYIACIFSSWGYKVKTNQFLSGYCCSGYEIDFTAQKNDILKIAECKYHNAKQGLVQLEIALANYARFLDLKKQFDFTKKTRPISDIKSILVTNTRFTSKAIEYCKCAGVELLGWNYPKDAGLEYFVDSQGLYPITILPSFQEELADTFSQNNLMLVKDLLNKDLKGLSIALKVPFNQLSSMADEAKTLFSQT